jgi:uncharacterized protein (TIGR02594 family)
MTEPPWLPIAEKYEGWHEIGDNQGLQHFIDRAHTGEEGDPWCAIFVNACLEGAGVRGSRSARARSFEDDPNFVKLDRPVRGAIFTRWRGDPNGKLGHTGFVLSANGALEVIAGNEDDAVRVYHEDKSKIVGYYWPHNVPLNGAEAAAVPRETLFFAHGRMSIFGGPEDSGSGDPAERLALWHSREQMSEAGFGDYLLPPSHLGLFRQLNPDKYYIACRWDYNETPAKLLRESFATVASVKTGKSVKCLPVDWGPNIRTGRIADLSPGAARALGIETDDVVTVTLSAREAPGEDPRAAPPPEPTMPDPQLQLPPPQVQRPPFPQLSPEEIEALRTLARNAARQSAPVLLPLLLKIVAVVFPQAAPWILVAQVLLVKLGVMGAPIVGLGVDASTTGAVVTSGALAMAWSGLLSRLSGGGKQT